MRIACWSTPAIDFWFRCVELVEERLYEQRQIVLALAQRRKADREHVQPVVQIFAELALLTASSGSCWWRR